MERVEDADEPGLAPSIDVNDNREEYKARVCVSNPERAGQGSVYRLAYASPGSAGLPTISSVVVGCRAGVLNGFPEELEVDMVCPDGEEGENLSCPNEPECVEKPDNGYLNSQLRSAVSFMGKSTPDMKMPNGDVTHEHMHHVQTPLRCLDYAHAEGLNRKVSALDRGVKVGNGGLLIVNSYDTLSQVPFGALGGLSAPESRVFVHQSGSVSSTGRSCERISRAITESSEEARPCDPDPADTLSELSAKLSLSPLAENTSDYTETDPSPEEDFSDTGPPLRPRNLRTNAGHIVSLSCDATPLSPVDDGYFGAEGGVDECLGSGGRRQSAPDRVAADPDPSSDQTLGTKRHGIAEFLTR